MRETDRQTETERHRQRDRDRQTQTERQDRETDRQTHRDTYTFKFLIDVISEGRRLYMLQFDVCLKSRMIVINLHVW